MRSAGCSSDDRTIKPETTMHTRPAARLAFLVSGAALATLLVAVPVAAKEGVEVTLAAPISPDAQPGETVPVFFLARAIGDNGTSPVYGTAIFIRLFGPTGAMTEATGAEQATPGTYRALIEIPAGGAVRAEFGIHGSGPNGPADVVWPYDGVIVAARVPPPVDPETSRLANPPRYQPVAPPAGAGAALATTPGSTAATATSLDLRLAAGVAALVAGSLAAAALLVGLRRRRGAPTAV
jgi:hypothetical protein